MSIIRAVIVKPKEEPKIVEIPNTLESFQDIVEGHIEAYGLIPNFSVYVNAEGYFLGLPLNRIIAYNGRVAENLMGNFVIFKHQNGEEINMSKEEAEHLVEIFSDDIVNLTTR